MIRHLPFQTPYSRHLAEKKGIDVIRCSPRAALPGRNPPLLVDFGHFHSSSPSSAKEGVRGWLGAYVGGKLWIVRCSARLPGFWSATACCRFRSVEACFRQRLEQARNTKAAARQLTGRTPKRFA